MATVITNDNIRNFVRKYCLDKKTELPPDLPKKIGEWDVSRVTDMSKLFSNLRYFNEPLNWDVSNVTDMNFMFDGCTKFNSPLTWNGGPWNVSNVTNMDSMFTNCKEFNQPLNWNVSNVTNMEYMFFDCTKFNSPLTWNGGPWNVSNVTNMDSMFADCKEFNQPLNWNVSNVTNMDSMFADCKEFKQTLRWNFSKNDNMIMFGMFKNCIHYDILNNFLLTSINYKLNHIFNSYGDLKNFAESLGINTQNLTEEQITNNIEKKIEEIRMNNLLYAMIASGKYKAKEANEIKQNREIMDNVLESLLQRGTVIRKKNKKNKKKTLKKSNSVPNNEKDVETAAMLTALEAEELKQYMGKGGRKTRKQRKTKKQK